MYDTISSHLTRILRRRWMLAVAVLLLGGLAGGAFSARGQNWSVRESIQVVKVSNVGGFLDIGFVQDLDVRLLAIQTTEDFSSTDAADTASVTASPDSVASVITITARASSQSRAQNGADAYVALLERRAVEPLLRQVDTGIESLETTRADFAADLTTLDAELGALDRDAPARDLAFVSRLDLQSQLRNVDARLNSLTEYRSYVSDDLVRRVASTTEAPGSIVTSVAVGVVLAGILLAAALAALVVSDHRIRRRMQIERVAPDATVLAVVPRLDTASTQQIARAARAVEAFSVHSGDTAVSVVGLSGEADAMRVIAALQPHLPSVTLHTAGDGDSSHGGQLLVVRWGATTEDQIAASSAAMFTSGEHHVASMLIDVPAADVDWAAVSSGRPPVRVGDDPR